MFKGGGKNRLRCYKMIMYNRGLFKDLKFKGLVNIFKTICNSCKHFNRILLLKVYQFSNDKLLNHHISKFKFKNT